LPSVFDRLLACHAQLEACGSTLRWEVLTIDNNSSDRTPEVVAEYQARWPQAGRLRCLRETSQGLAFARQRAIESSSAPIVGFLDDDNLPAPDWPIAIVRFLRDRPRAAAIGSRVLPKYEVPPPPDFSSISGFLALTDRGDFAKIYQPAARVLPPGAGLVVRRDLWLKLVPKRLQLVGRVNGQMRASEDLEAILHFQNAGWEIWYVPDAIVYHQIPKWRLTEEYLSRLMYGIGLTRYRTRMIRYAVWLRVPMWFLYVASDLSRLVRHRWHYGRHWRSRLVAVARRQLYIGSLAGMWQTPIDDFVQGWTHFWGKIRGSRRSP